MSSNSHHQSPYNLLSSAWLIDFESRSNKFAILPWNWQTPPRRFPTTPNFWHSCRRSQDPRNLAFFHILTSSTVFYSANRRSQVILDVQREMNGWEMSIENEVHLQLGKRFRTRNIMFSTCVNYRDIWPLVVIIIDVLVFKNWRESKSKDWRNRPVIQTTKVSVFFIICSVLFFIY